MNIPFEETEVKNAINQLKKDKTPGKDGLTAEFYQECWEEIRPLFMSMLTYSYTSQHLGESMLLGVLNLIPKPKRDSRLLKNLRPITLLNSDYKIIEKCVINRIEPHLHYLINQDQKGFLSGRRISANIRKILDIMHITERENIEAVVLNLDFRKAFDEISFSAILGALEAFNFPTYITQWINILYTNFCIQVQNNGKFSNTLEVTRGLHQGGCASTAIFLLVAETLAEEIRTCEKIHGISVNSDTTALLDQFADDADIFSMFKEDSINGIIQCLINNKGQTGLTVNYDKTTLYRIGSLKKSKAQLYTQPNIKWTNGPVNVLGITVDHDDIIRLNYTELMEKAESTLLQWHNRNISLHGKVLVINTLVMSLFIYRMMVLPRMPKNMCKKMNELFNRYLWGGKRPKIKLDVLQQSKQQGGLNLTNLEDRDSAIKITWLQVLEEDRKTAEIAYAAMGNPAQSLKELIWSCNFHWQDVQVMLPKSNTFWKEVMEAWAKLNFDTSNEAHEQIIWCNSFVRINQSPVFWPKAFQKGLIYIFQLYPRGEEITERVAKEQYELNFLERLMLLQSILTQWRNQGYAPLVRSSTQYEKLKEKRNLAGHAYAKLRENRYPDQPFLQWAEDLSLEPEYDDYIQAFKNIYVASNIPKYRSFQYRLLHRAVVTNVQLCRWKIKSTNMCTFCAEDQETLLHLFINCKEVKKTVGQHPGAQYSHT